MATRAVSYAVVPDEWGPPQIEAYQRQTGAAGYIRESEAREKRPNLNIPEVPFVWSEQVPTPDPVPDTESPLGLKPRQAIITALQTVYDQLQIARDSAQAGMDALEALRAQIRAG